MGELAASLVIAAVLALVFATWALAWRGKRRRQSALGPAPVAPAGLGEPDAAIRALYLATTRADAPLERIAVDGLGFRAEAQVRVHATGVELALAGRRDAVFVARDRIRGAGRANWTIDRASGGDRLVALRWSLGDGDAATDVDSYLRAHDPAALLAALDSLVPADPKGGDPA